MRRSFSATISAAASHSKRDTTRELITPMPAGVLRALRSSVQRGACRTDMRTTTSFGGPPGGSCQSRSLHLAEASPFRPALTQLGRGASSLMRAHWQTTLSSA